MFIQPVCAEEILFHIDMIDNKKSNDTYDIPVQIIKLSKHIIAPVLTTIFNNCIAEGMYPDALKVAKFSLYIKVVTLQIHLIIDPFPYFHISEKFLKKFS